MSSRRSLRQVLRVGSGPRLRKLLLALVALISATVAIAGYAGHALRTQDLSTVDARFAVRGAQRPPSNIVIVKVDDVTFSDLNRQWPFLRAVHARVLNRIAAQHPAAIAYDVQFSEPSPGSATASQNDEVALLSAVNDAHHAVVFSTTETERNGDTKFLGSTQGTKLLGEVGSRAGDGLFPSESSGGVIRQMFHSHSNLPTLAVATAEVAAHR